MKLSLHNLIGAALALQTGKQQGAMEARQRQQAQEAQDFDRMLAMAQMQHSGQERAFQTQARQGEQAGEMLRSGMVRPDHPLHGQLMQQFQGGLSAQPPAPLDPMALLRSHPLGRRMALPPAGNTGASTVPTVPTVPTAAPPAAAGAAPAVSTAGAAGGSPFVDPQEEAGRRASYETAIEMRLRELQRPDLEEVRRRGLSEEVRALRAGLARRLPIEQVAVKDPEGKERLLGAEGLAGFSPQPLGLNPAVARAANQTLTQQRKNLEELQKLPEDALTQVERASLVTALNDLPQVIVTADDMQRADAIIDRVRPLLVNPNLNSRQYERRQYEADAAAFEKARQELDTLGDEAAATHLVHLLDQEKRLRAHKESRGSIPPRFQAHAAQIETIRAHLDKGEPEAAAELARHVSGRMRRRMTPAQERAAFSTFLRAVGLLPLEQANDPETLDAMASKFGVDHLLAPGMRLGGRAAEERYHKLVGQMANYQKLDGRAQGVFIDELLGAARAAGRKLDLDAGFAIGLSDTEMQKLALASRNRELNIKGQKLENEALLIRLRRAQLTRDKEEAEAAKEAPGSAAPPKSAYTAKTRAAQYRAKQTYEALQNFLAVQHQAARQGEDWYGYDLAAGARDLAAGRLDPKKHARHIRAVALWKEWRAAEATVDAVIEKQLQGAGTAPSRAPMGPPAPSGPKGKSGDPLKARVEQELKRAQALNGGKPLTEAQRNSISRLVRSRLGGSP